MKPSNVLGKNQYGNNETQQGNSSLFYMSEYGHNFTFYTVTCQNILNYHQEAEYVADINRTFLV